MYLMRTLSFIKFNIVKLCTWAYSFFLSLPDPDSHACQEGTWRTLRRKSYVPCLLFLQCLSPAFLSLMKPMYMPSGRSFHPIFKQSSEQWTYYYHYVKYHGNVTIVLKYYSFLQLVTPVTSVYFSTFRRDAMWHVIL